MSHRFFIPASCITPPTVTLPADAARQVRTVLRMRPGQIIMALDNSGMEFQVELTQVDKAAVCGQIVARQPAPAEPTVQLWLYQAVLKAQKFEWILQKGTELGVARFVPVITERAVVRNPAALDKKRERWRHIIREAAEQSGRGHLPELLPAMPLADALAESAGCDRRLMPWEEASRSNTLQNALTGAPVSTIAVFIGPEGGFAPPEAAAAESAGVQLVSLGPRILRAETAALAVCATTMFALRQWH
ncbi:MAG: 16S rRNA (uracil(1498)-N(3))-methyltransferase [Chloroflexi bacterium]|nr:MAG: 16S rRNA (uracil(1498)-N(3))-methyltransferase [Chloroflexota bacterium]